MKCPNIDGIDSAALGVSATSTDTWAAMSATDDCLWQTGSVLIQS
jgi:hypothetical protein